MLFFIYPIIITCVDIVIQPFTKDNELKYLNHSLKPVDSKLDDETIYWSLDSNGDGRYRIRTGQYYLGESKMGGKVVKKNGGAALGKFSEDERMKDIKKHLESDDSKERDNKSKDGAKDGNENVEDEEGDGEGDVDKKDVKGNKDGSTGKSGSTGKKGTKNDANKGNAGKGNTKGKGGPNGKKGEEEILIEDPIIEKKQSLTGGFVDSLAPEFLENFTRSGLMGIESAFVKNNEESPSSSDTPVKDTANEDTPVKNATNEDTPVKNATNDDTPVKNATKGDTPVKDATKGDAPPKDKHKKPLNKKKAHSKRIDPFLADGSQDLSLILSNLTESTAKKQVVDPGFVFQLFPVFMNTLDKRHLILINSRCLTHQMSLEACDFEDYWSLKDNFYWSIYRVDNPKTLNKLKKLINEKIKNSEDVRKTQVVNPDICKRKISGGGGDVSDQSGGVAGNQIPDGSPPSSRAPGNLPMVQPNISGPMVRPNISGPVMQPSIGGPVMHPSIGSPMMQPNPKAQQMESHKVDAKIVPGSSGNPPITFGNDLFKKLVDAAMK